MKLSLNVVTFVPKDQVLPRLDRYLMDGFMKVIDQVNELENVEVKIFFNSEMTLSVDNFISKIRSYFNPGKVTFYTLNKSVSLGVARNFLLEKSIENGCTHIINLDDDDYMVRIDRIVDVIKAFPDKPIYIQRLKDGKPFPSVDGDTSDYILHGKFIANGYACMVMPISWMLKYRLNFPEFIDTYEDNLFYMKMLMNYNGDFIFMANPLYIQTTHAAGEFSMTTKASDKLKKEEYRLVNQLTKFDSYHPDFSHIVIHDGNQIRDIDKAELIKYDKLVGIEFDKSVKAIAFINGQFKKMPEMVKDCGDIHRIFIGGVAYAISRIVTLREFLNYNSFYHTYRLVSSSETDPLLVEIRKELKDRYFNGKESPLSEDLLNTNIVFITAWNSLSQQ